MKVVSRMEQRVWYRLHWVPWNCVPMSKRTEKLKATMSPYLPKFP